MNVIQINKFSQLHNGKSIFFCKTDFIFQAFDSIRHLKNKIILISGNSDYCITDEIASKAPKNIFKWFCQNRLSNNPLLESIPLGVENTAPCRVEGHGHVWDHAHEKTKLIESKNIHQVSETNLAYANFNVHTNPPHRNLIKSHILKLKHVTWRDPSPDYKSFFQDILNHQATICPQGNDRGDNHRIYEVLYAGRVPITFNRAQYEYLHHIFPTLLINDIQELDDYLELKTKINQVKNMVNKNYLNCDYWINKILDYEKECNLIG